MIVDMTKFTPNEGGSLTVYPEGIYKVQVTANERCTASTGFPQIKWSTDIVEPQEYAGKKLTFFTGMTDKTVFRTLNAIYACSVDLPRAKLDTDGPIFDKALAACLHQTLGVEVVEAEYNGKPKNDMKNFMRDPDNQDVKSVGTDEVPEFLREPGQDDEEQTPPSTKQIKAAEKAGLIKKGSSILKPQPKR